MGPWRSAATRTLDVRQRPLNKLRRQGVENGRRPEGIVKEAAITLMDLGRIQPYHRTRRYSLAMLIRLESARTPKTVARRVSLPFIRVAVRWSVVLIAAQYFNFTTRSG